MDGAGWGRGEVESLKGQHRSFVMMGQFCVLMVVVTGVYIRAKLHDYIHTAE